MRALYSQSYSRLPIISSFSPGMQMKNINFGKSLNITSIIIEEACRTNLQCLHNAKHGIIMFSCKQSGIMGLPSICDCDLQDPTGRTLGPIWTGAGKTPGWSCASCSYILQLVYNFFTLLVYRWCGYYFFASCRRYEHSLWPHSVQ